MNHQLGFVFDLLEAINDAANVAGVTGKLEVVATTSNILDTVTIVWHPGGPRARGDTCQYRIALEHGKPIHGPERFIIEAVRQFQSMWARSLPVLKSPNAKT